MTERPNWQYDELRQVGTDFTDEEEVCEYDEWMQKLRKTKEENEDVLDWLGNSTNDTIMEFGCGTGEFAIEAAGHCKKVIAVDVSPRMLEFAQKKAEQGNIKNIEFRQGGFLTYEHQGGLVDAAVSQLALHHLPDFWKLVALKNVCALLKGGGKFYLRDIVYSFDVDDYKNFFKEWAEKTERATNEKRAACLEASIREEYMTVDWIMEGLLKKAGFAVKKAEYHGGFMAVYKCRKKRGEQKWTHRRF